MKLQHRQPYPGTFLIGKTGIVRIKLGLEGYRERHSPSELIDAAKALKPSD